MTNVYQMDKKFNLTVLPLKEPSYLKRIKCADDAMAVLRTEMHKLHPDDLGEAVGVTAGCIRAIRSGRTKWPRHTTFFALIDVLDLELTLLRKGKS